MVNMGEIFAHARISNLEMDRVPLNEVEKQNFVLEEGDLLFARQSLVESGAGKCSIVHKLSEMTTFESHLIRVRIDKSIADPYFYFYFFQSQVGRNTMKSIVEQVAAAGIRGSDLAKLQVPITSLNEQKAIAQVLATFDDKIELNRRMNATLEAMAQTLFRAWFVDFEPVKAKAAGLAPIGLDAETAALFPTEFVASTCGPIPKGWELGTLNDVCDLRRDTVQPLSVPAATPYIGLEHMPQKSIALDSWGVASQVNSMKARFEQGDILFGKLRPYFHKVGVAPLKGICSTDILVLKPKSDELFGMALCILSSEDMISYASRLADGAKMPRVNWKDISEFPVILPSHDLQKALSNIVRRAVAKIHSNIVQSRSLLQIRDELLPRLISGQLDVSKLLEVFE